MRLLVIGGSGFVSGTLARLAVAAGHETWIVTRGHRPTPEGLTALRADRKDDAAFGRAVEQAGGDWDLVVDCIGYDAADARQDLAVFGKRARQLVFISTDFVFDPARRTFPQAEEGVYLDDGSYGAKKRQCELAMAEGDTRETAWTVLRPCHIYGPGSQLGCLPEHGRDPELIARLRRGESLRLVGGGHFLQQPILAEDLAKLILSCAGNAKAHGRIYNAAGPDIVESREYYRIIAEVLHAELKVEEVPVGEYLSRVPANRSFLCHRIYDLSRLRADGLAAPATPIAEGLRRHVESLPGRQA